MNQKSEDPKIEDNISEPEEVSDENVADVDNKATANKKKKKKKKNKGKKLQKKLIFPRFLQHRKKNVHRENSC